MKPVRCVLCGHPVGGHSHIIPHPCKLDGCTCPEYEREERP